MKKFTTAALLIVFSAIGPLFLSSSAIASTAPAMKTESKKIPLLILRFNKPGVQYKQPLKQVVERVLEVKPDANFELLSLVPVYMESAKNTSSRQVAEHNAGKIAAAIESYDVETNHIRIRYQESKTVPMNEVHIFAY